MRARTAAIGLFIVWSVTFLLWACGSKTSPSSPAPVAVPASTPPAGTHSVTGLVADLTGSRPLAGATVSAISGSNAGRSTTTGANGRFVLANLLSGPATLRAVATGYATSDTAITSPTDAHADFRLPNVVPLAPASPPCDPGLWPHMHDVQRIKIIKACQTVTGVIATAHASDDGDIDMQLTLDPGYASLLNSGNLAKLNGNLQTEAICQAPVHSDVPDAQRTCANFTGTVPIPAIGTHVQVTGVYVLDSDHGWMEIHPISVLGRVP